MSIVKELLISRLSDPSRPNHINLKELRDILLEYRASSSVMISWGVWNEGRLGVGQIKETQSINASKRIFTEREEEDVEEENKEDSLKLLKPQIIKIPNKFINYELQKKTLYQNIIKIACGNSHTLALNSYGWVFSWGINNKGCLGLPQDWDYTSPQLIEKDTYGMIFNSITDIAWGSTHSMAISKEYRTYSWGNGDGGRLGHGNIRSEAIPKEIKQLNEIQPKHIFAGEAHSACINHKNSLFTWGKGSYGRLGHGFTNDCLFPQEVEELIGIKIEDVVLGTYHTFAISSDRHVYAWGGWNFGKLGIHGRSSGNLIVPHLVHALVNKNVREIATGTFHSLCITDSGSLYAWGNSKQGKLGFKNQKSVEIPTKLSELDIKFGKIVQK